MKVQRSSRSRISVLGVLVYAVSVAAASAREVRTRNDFAVDKTTGPALERGLREIGLSLWNCPGASPPNSNTRLEALSLFMSGSHGERTPRREAFIDAHSECIASVSTMLGAAERVYWPQAQLDRDWTEVRGEDAEALSGLLLYFAQTRMESGPREMALRAARCLIVSCAHRPSLSERLLAVRLASRFIRQRGISAPTSCLGIEWGELVLSGMEYESNLFRVAARGHGVPVMRDVYPEGRIDRVNIGRLLYLEGQLGARVEDVIARPMARRAADAIDTYRAAVASAQPRADADHELHARLEPAWEPTFAAGLAQAVRDAEELDRQQRAACSGRPVTRAE
jgi:hypothetical protein